MPKYEAGEFIFNDSGGDVDFRIESNTEENMFFVNAGDDTVYIGGTTSGAVIAKGGAFSWSNPSSMRLTMRPALVAGRIGAQNKPTPVVVGAHAGYSFPIFNSDDEEIFFREYVAGRWDGLSDITVSVICCLAAAEDVGDYFKFQLSWETKATGSGVISTSTTDVLVEQAVLADRAAQYSIYKLEFTIDWDGPNPDMAASDHTGSG